LELIGNTVVRQPVEIPGAVVNVDEVFGVHRAIGHLQLADGVVFVSDRASVGASEVGTLVGRVGNVFVGIKNGGVVALYEIGRGQSSVSIERIGNVRSVGQQQLFDQRATGSRCTQCVGEAACRGNDVRQMLRSIVNELVRPDTGWLLQKQVGSQPVHISVR